MTAMRPSIALAKLRAGKIARCVKINTSDPRVVELAALCGFDCIWTDIEHIANDWSTIERQNLAAKAHGVDLLVRVSRGGYSDYVRPLELDAAGIMAPHVMDLDDARRVIHMTRFHPVGRRPLDGGNADALFCRLPLAEYIENANRERFVAIQIEDPEPMEELDAIAALDGIDMLFFGPGDFSHSIGDPGNFSNPALIDARARVAEAAVRHGKFAGTVGSPDSIGQLYGLGYRFISVGADVVGLGAYFSDIIGAFDEFEPI